MLWALGSFKGKTCWINEGEGMRRDGFQMKSDHFEVGPPGMLDDMTSGKKSDKFKK